jgi:hypothetical protein
MGAGRKVVGPAPRYWIFGKKNKINKQINLKLDGNITNINTKYWKCIF